MRLFFNFLPVLLLCTIVSCGNSKSSSNKGNGQQSEQAPTPTPTPTPGGITQNESPAADGSNVQGIYAADLYPINYNLQFLKGVGKAAIVREGDTFSAKVKMDYGSRQTVMKQAVHTGRRCPNMTDDLNKDAYIDIQEAMIAIGKVTIPLDGNLDGQVAGLESFPVGDVTTGKYFYQLTASFERMFADLKGVDENLNDNIVKIAEQDGITLPGRIILIQGLAESVDLSLARVATVEGETVHSSMPIACGVLWKVEKFPDGL